MSDIHANRIVVLYQRHSRHVVLFQLHQLFLARIAYSNYLLINYPLSMMMKKILLGEYKTFLRRKPNESVIDFDNRFTRKFDLQAHRFEDVLKDTNRTIPPNRWSYHRIGLTKEGSGEFMVEEL